MTGAVNKSNQIDVNLNPQVKKTIKAQNSSIIQVRNDQEVLSKESSGVYIPGTPLPKKTPKTTTNNTQTESIPSYSSIGSNGRVDKEKLPEAFAQAETEYIQKTGKHITDSSKDVSTYDFLTNHLQPYDIMDSKYRSGKEKEFMAGVQQLVNQNNGTRKKIAPEDLYRIALEVNDGDRFKALLTVQDSLKMTGRAYEVGTAFGTEEIHIKDMVGEEFFNNYVKNHGGEYKPEMANKMGEAFLSENLAPMGNYDDFTGNYYHMFGTAAGSVSGEIADAATLGHAALKNFASVKGHFDDVYGTNETKNVVGRTIKDVGSSMSAVLTGGFFWGEYTTGNPEKWGADLSGLNIAARLKSNK